jgi:hypothetical protein
MNERDGGEQGGAVELHVTMPDGSVWAVPAHLIADSYASFYASKAGPKGSPEYQQAHEGEYRDALASDDTLTDWAAGDMNWSDVQTHARQVSPPPSRQPDYEDGWANGEQRVVRTPTGT